MRIIEKTNVGNIRKTNEDTISVTRNKVGYVLLIVADGMGGHNAGEIASALANSIIKKDFEETDENTNYKDFIQKTILKANNEIYSQSLINSQYSRMGTTVSMVIDTGKVTYIGHIGDSRVYYVNKDKIRQLTKDHTVVQALYEEGHIGKKDIDNHPYRNILLQSLGTSKKVTVDILEIRIPYKGYLLLCSDGLSEEIKDNQIKIELLKEDKRLLSKARNIMDLALSNKGKDNISFIIMERDSK